jgi:hypothetical protein
VLQFQKISILLLKKQNTDQIDINEKMEEIGKRKALPGVLRSQTHMQPLIWG